MMRAFEAPFGSMDRAFLGFAPLAEVGSRLGMKSLSCDIAETDKEYVISVDTPGISKDGIAVEVNEETGMLTISAEKSLKEDVKNEASGEEKAQEEVKWHRVERAYGKVSRSLALPEDADYNSIAAKLDNGVLKITMPKTAKPASNHTKRIEIA
jgi:HSP20 family protein